MIWASSQWPPLRWTPRGKEVIGHSAVASGSAGGPVARPWGCRTRRNTAGWGCRKPRLWPPPTMGGGGGGRRRRRRRRRSTGGNVNEPTAAAAPAAAAQLGHVRTTSFVPSDTVCKPPPAFPPRRHVTCSRVLWPHFKPFFSLLFCACAWGVGWGGGETNKRSAHRYRKRVGTDRLLSRRVVVRAEFLLHE